MKKRKDDAEGAPGVIRMMLLVAVVVVIAYHLVMH